MKQILILLILVMTIPSVEAKSKVQTCKEGFIGYEYREELEKTCRPLWRMWTRHILKSFNQK